VGRACGSLTLNVWGSRGSLSLVRILLVCPILALQRDDHDRYNPFATASHAKPITSKSDCSLFGCLIG
jgi:hypothetical protein